MAVPPPNVKVYDRPEKKGPSPIVLAIVVLVVAIVGFFVYKAMHHDAPTPAANTRPGILMMSSVSPHRAPKKPGILLIVGSQAFSCRRSKLISERR
jgi:hypothetical protein